MADYRALADEARGILRASGAFDRTSRIFALINALESSGMSDARVVADLRGAVEGVERYLTDALKMFDAGSSHSARAYVESALADLRRARGR